MERIREYIVLDMEMTGLSPGTEKVIEIGAVRFCDGKPAEHFACLVNSGRKVPANITQLTGITDEMVQSGRPEDEAMEGLLAFLGDHILVGQNIRFDYSFLAQWCSNRRRSVSLAACDTLKLARILLPAEQSKKLEELCRYFDIPRENAHRALDDAIETGYVFERLQDMALTREDAAVLLTPKTLICKVKRQTPATPQQIRRLKEYHRRFAIPEEPDYAALTRSEASRLHDRYITEYGRL